MSLRRWLLAVALPMLSLAAFPLWARGAPRVAAQSTPAPQVYAEAIGQANLRAGPGVEYAQVGTIANGTRYPVLARHVYVPWLRLDVPNTAEAWVFADLVTVTGSLSDVPGQSVFPSVDAPPATLTPTLVAPAGGPPTPGAPTATPTLTPTLSGPLATTLGEANLRFGPDLSYPVIVRAPQGASFRIIERHALVPWLRVALPESPTGSGWLYSEVVEISGSLSGVPVTEASVFSYPTLTPTPQTIIVGGSPWDGAPVAAGRLADTLGMAMHEYLLAQGFAPTGDQIASVFLLDLRTGDTFTLNGDVAYSGMSLTKLPIVVTYFLTRDGPLSRDDAFLVADTMMCSENITSNALLAQIGGGDARRGAGRVTVTMQQLGLGGTFIMRPFTIREGEPVIEVGTITTGADQTRTRPDPTNQIVPADLGWLLASIYQCAQGEGGLLWEHFPDAITIHECRQMLTALDANAVGVFLEAGVPLSARVLHKHGWIGDTHGDAGLVIGPDAAYVLVVALYGRDWLEFDLSAPVVGELSRLAWNALNPAAPLDAVASRIVPADCDPWGDPVIAALQAPSLPPIE